MKDKLSIITSLLHNMQQADFKTKKSAIFNLAIEGSVRLEIFLENFLPHFSLQKYFLLI